MRPNCFRDTRLTSGSSIEPPFHSRILVFGKLLVSQYISFFLLSQCMQIGSFYFAWNKSIWSHFYAEEPFRYCFLRVEKCCQVNFCRPHCCCPMQRATRLETNSVCTMTKTTILSLSFRLYSFPAHRVPCEFRSFCRWDEK